MPHYVDGFVIPIPARKVEAYRRIARQAGRVWLEHGALDYVECVGDDMKVQVCMPFPRGIRARRGETVLFSWIVYKSRAHRDRVNAKVMQDPRISEMMKAGDAPFDVKRMLYGGFKVIVGR
jgi:uncharacterized protein YbaA (DUF1428 family)